MKKSVKRYLAGAMVCYLCMTVRTENFFITNAEYLIAPGLTTHIEGNQAAGARWMDRLCSVLFPIQSHLSASFTGSVTEDDKTGKLILGREGKEKAVQIPATQQKSALDQSGVKNMTYQELLRTFYTVDPVTYADQKLINAEEMLSRDMRLSEDTKGYQVLIFHTHAQEAFADSKKNDVNTSIVGMGAYLSELLNRKGIRTLHHDGVYDLVNGKLDRSKAYELSEAGVKKILKQNSDIEVVIDLHRDGVSESTHLVTNINGKKTAKIMFFNGLSRTKQNGELSYLYNPYRKENLAFSFQTQLACEKRYPGFARHIYLKGYRYSLHMRPKSLLIEAGAQNNTVEEMRNAMELLSDVLVDVLK